MARLARGDEAALRDFAGIRRSDMGSTGLPHEMVKDLQTAVSFAGVRRDASASSLRKPPVALNDEVARIDCGHWNDVVDDPSPAGVRLVERPAKWQ